MFPEGPTPEAAPETDGPLLSWPGMRVVCSDGELRWHIRHFGHTTNSEATGTGQLPTPDNVRDSYSGHPR
jgi:hypothetical protein